jgi:hypothetical protein
MSGMQTTRLTVEQAQAQISATTNPIMRYFDFAHLPVHLQEISQHFALVATFMDAQLPDSAEKSAGLRKLLEAKDCFVRAKLG